MLSIQVLSTEDFMTLDEYLKKAPRGEAARIARELRLPPIRLTDFRIGRRVPGIEVAAAISLATNCLVTPQELRPACDWTKIRRALRR